MFWLVALSEDHFHQSSDVRKLTFLDISLSLVSWFYVSGELLIDESASVISVSDVFSVYIKVWTVHLFHFTYVRSL